jgi:hypothetical protein
MHRLLIAGRGGTFAHWPDIARRIGGLPIVAIVDIGGWRIPVYAGPMEMTGRIHALEHLRLCRGGRYAANPVV